MKKKNAEITQFRCKKCDAPYPLGADDVIATCPYCGFTFEIGSDEIQHFIVRNRLDKKSIIPFITEWIRSVSPKTVGSAIVKDIDNITPMLEWIPVFRIEGSYSSQYSGYRRIEGGNLLLPIEESISGKMTEWVLARRHSATYGIDKFIGSLKDSELAQFKIDTTGDSPVLNSEISFDDATRRVQKICSDQHRKAIEGVVLDHHFEMKPGSADYVHVPYWLVRYSYQKGTFRTAISGATGEVLFGELPATKKYRFKKWLISILVAVVAAFLFQTGAYTAILLGGEAGAEGATVFVLFTCFIMALIPFTLKESFLYEIEVDKDGNETREWLGDERVD